MPAPNVVSGYGQRNMRKSTGRLKSLGQMLKKATSPLVRKALRTAPYTIIALVARWAHAQIALYFPINPSEILDYLAKGVQEVVSFSWPAKAICCVIACE